jgi:hypothetical protein
MGKLHTVWAVLCWQYCGSTVLAGQLHQQQESHVCCTESSVSLLYLPNAFMPILEPPAPFIWLAQPSTYHNVSHLVNIVLQCTAVFAVINYIHAPGSCTHTIKLQSEVPVLPMKYAVILNSL